MCVQNVRKNIFIKSGKRPLFFFWGGGCFCVGAIKNVSRSSSHLKPSQILEDVWYLKTPITCDHVQSLPISNCCQRYRPPTTSILASKTRQLKALGWHQTVHHTGLYQEGVGVRHHEPGGNNWHVSGKTKPIQYGKIWKMKDPVVSHQCVRYRSFWGPCGTAGASTPSSPLEVPWQPCWSTGCSRILALQKKVLSLKPPPHRRKADKYRHLRQSQTPRITSHLSQPFSGAMDLSCCIHSRWWSAFGR